MYLSRDFLSHLRRYLIFLSETDKLDDWHFTTLTQEMSIFAGALPD